MIPRKEAAALRVYLVTLPGSAPDICAAPTVCLAYGLDRDGALVRRNTPNGRGGLLGLCGAFPPTLADPDALLRTLDAECAARGFGGVLADPAGTPTGEQRALLCTLAQRLRRGGRRLYVPQDCAVEGAHVLVGSAVSGGTLRALLCEAIGRYGAGCTALAAEQLCMDFALPCPTGVGAPLTAPAFDALRRAHGAKTHFSAELCARYFTYCEGQTLHLVLFDDADTLRRKLSLARSLGVGDAFLCYPELNGVYDALFPGGQLTF